MTKPTLWKQIPSEWFDFQEIYDEAVRTAPLGAALVEVGNFWGQSVVYLAEAAKLADKGLRVYAVDLFDMRPDNNPPLFDASLGGGEPRIHAQFHNSQFETFAHFVDATRLSPEPLRILRMESLEAARLHIPGIHFVFLDGDHEYAYLLRELRAWSLQVSRHGGILAGHDWHPEFPGVQQAVEEYCGKGVAKVECGRSWVVRL